jgi:sugar phosphate isomerase/epimerase
VKHHGFHLTYCTNIHAADGWAAVFDNLRRYGPALKRRFAPDTPFGIGLRLSARDARELLDGHVDEFRDWLAGEGLYVAIINGFPFGAFHRSVVKADVYAPAWTDMARTTYTLDLVEILAALLPPGLDGGVSTAPLAYKAWMPATDRESWRAAAANVAQVALHLARRRRERGIDIHLDIEPEPDCSIENTDETLAFFQDWLLPAGAPLLARELGISEAEARQDLLRHVRVCFDCCHFAVEYEDPIAALQRLTAAGIGIGRIQLSSALRVALPDDRDAQSRVTDRLRPFDDATYLHQVIARRADRLEHFPDLGDAIAACHGDCGSEWRIHFHVPLFARDYDGLESTQDDVGRVIDFIRRQPVTTHLEIETYTWDVLPGALKLDLAESIGREYDWVLQRFRDPSLRGPVIPFRSPRT